MKTIVDREVGMRYLSDTTHSLSLFVMLAGLQPDPTLFAEISYRPALR
jgi:hypothetical protein